MRRTPAAALAILLGLGAVALVVLAQVQAASVPNGQLHPGGTRLVGAKGLVVEVPAWWGTDLSPCGAQVPFSVHVEIADLLPSGGLCGLPAGVTVPAVPSLTVYDDGGDLTPGAMPLGTIDGMAYYPSTEIHGIVFPDQGVGFGITGASARQTQQILDSVRAVPAGQTTVALQSRLVDLTGTRPHEGSVSQQVDSISAEGGLVLTTREVAQAGTFPGQLLRTEPPIDSAVARGSTIDVVYSAGDLDHEVSTTALAAAGWDLVVPTSADATLTRIQAERLGGDPGQTDGVYLRRLNDQLVWLLTQRRVEDQAGGRSVVCLKVLDATTGNVLADRLFPAAG